MLGRIPAGIKEYLVCCLPIANIVAHKKAEAVYLTAVKAAVEPAFQPQALQVANKTRDSFHRSYMLGLVTQVVAAIACLALAILFAPTAPPLAALALFSFACLGLSVAVSLPAYFIQKGFEIK